MIIKAICEVSFPGEFPINTNNGTFRRAEDVPVAVLESAVSRTLEKMVKGMTVNSVKLQGCKVPV
jgi:hypothetical protein